MKVKLENIEHTGVISKELVEEFLKKHSVTQTFTNILETELPKDMFIKEPRSYRFSCEVENIVKRVGMCKFTFIQTPLYYLVNTHQIIANSKCIYYTIDFNTFREFFRVSLTNNLGVMTTIENLSSVKVLQSAGGDHVIDKKEVYELTNSPRISGYANAGYDGELKNRIQSIEENKSSDTDIQNSIEIYEIIEKVKELSTIQF